MADRGGGRRAIVRLGQGLRPYLPHLGVAFVLVSVWGALGLWLPQFVGQLVDISLTQDTFARVDTLIAELLVLSAVYVALGFGATYLLGWIGERVARDLRASVLARMLKLPRAWHGEADSGALASRLTDDVSRVQRAVSVDLVAGLRSAIVGFGGGAFLVHKDWQLAAVLLALVPIFGLLNLIWGRRILGAARRLQAQRAETNAIAQRTLANVDLIKAFAAEPSVTRDYQAGLGRAFEAAVDAFREHGIFLALTTLGGMWSIAGVYWFGAHRVVAGAMSSGDLASFLLYTLLVVGSLGSLAGVAGQWHQVVGATGEIFAILDAAPPTPATASTSVDLPSRVRGDVAFENVGFTYEGTASPQLAGLSFRVQAGQMCALVGPSGAGKTTALRLLLRLIEPTTGRVTLDGHDLRHLDLTRLRERIGVVPQESVLFTGTIADNLRFGLPTATSAQLEHAARLACAHDFIEKLPEGYDTKVGENGAKLSGGQRQRIALARALVRQPDILLLDEPTSALDPASEEMIRAALEGLRGQHTILIIAHRPSTIRGADQVLVFRDGAVVEDGALSVLQRRDGAYAEWFMHGGGGGGLKCA